jgi:membrane protein required for colicin V production
MSKLDIILSIPLLWGAIIGFKKGLILELASLVALILGIIGALKFSDLTATYLGEWMEIEQQWMGLISFLVTFIVIVFAVFMLAKIIDKALKIVALGMLNRILGMLFGILKYALILSFLLFFFDNINQRMEFTSTDYKTQSLLIGPLELIASPFKSLMNDVSLDQLSDSL